jgi:hypothetical protein
MNINRHNYEECFILYMDNELNSDGRRQVEEFVQKNPDLKEELDILFQYKMAPDTGIVFENKSQLIKQEGNSPVNLANYEEWLVLYMDNELTAEQKTAVDQFIVNHPSAKEELTVLLRTKLQPEKIIFANKETLYRREEKVRTMPVRWWRIAAAAVLILAASLTAVIILNKKSPLGKEVAKIPVNGKKTNTENPVVTSKQINQGVTQPGIANNVKQVATPTSNQITNNVVVKHSNSTNQKLKNNLPVQINKEESAVAENKQKPSNNLPQPIKNPNINNDAIKDVAIADKSKEFPPVTINTPPPSDKIENTPDKKNENNGLLYASETNAKKNNLRSFFRKVTRTFEKRTGFDPVNEDGKVMIAGLALKLN